MGTKRRRENAMVLLTQTMLAINLAKTAMPIQLGQGILSTTESLLLVVKVGSIDHILPEFTNYVWSGHHQEQGRLWRTD